MIYSIIMFQLVFFSDNYSVTMNKEYGTIASCMVQGFESVKNTDLAFECKMVEKTVYEGVKK